MRLRRDRVGDKEPWDIEGAEAMKIGGSRMGRVWQRRLERPIHAKTKPLIGGFGYSLLHMYALI